MRSVARISCHHIQPITFFVTAPTTASSCEKRNISAVSSINSDSSVCQWCKYNILLIRNQKLGIFSKEICHLYSICDMLPKQDKRKTIFRKNFSKLKLLLLPGQLNAGTEDHWDPSCQDLHSARTLRMLSKEAGTREYPLDSLPQVAHVALKL